VAPFFDFWQGPGLRTVFDKIAQRFWTHEVRPEGASPCSGRVNPTLSARQSGIRSVFMARVTNRRLRVSRPYIVLNSPGQASSRKITEYSIPGAGWHTSRCRLSDAVIEGASNNSKSIGISVHDASKRFFHACFSCSWLQW
jgi:hypothetical protein